MVRDLGVVEDPPIRLHPAVLEHLLGERGDIPHAGERVHRLLDGGDVILRQRACIGTRVGKHFVALVERLCERKGSLGRKSEAPVCLALQAGQVVEQRRSLGRGFGLLDGRALPSGAGGGDRLGARRIPESFGLALGIVVLLESRIEPAAGVLARRGAESGMDLPAVARQEGAYLLLALDQDRERRRLNPTDRGEIEAALLGIERSHRARAVDPNQPVGLGSGFRRVGQGQQIAVLPQAGESVADGRLRHRLQPQAFDRFPGFRVLGDIAENQLALPAGIAGIDDSRDILSLEEFQQDVEPGLTSVDRRQIEMRRYHRQIRERPLAFLDVVLGRQREFQQMSHRGRQHILVAFEILALAGEPAQRARYVGGN